MPLFDPSLVQGTVICHSSCGVVLVVKLFDTILSAAMCLEKRAFFRVISGMHTSINTHLSALYITSGKNTNAPTFGPNLNEFVRRFDAATTNGQGHSLSKPQVLSHPTKHFFTPPPIPWPLPHPTSTPSPLLLFLAPSSILPALLHPFPILPTSFLIL